MKYQKTQNVSGAWLKSQDIKNGTKAKLVSETNPQPSQFLDKNGNTKTQNVAKIRVSGVDEPLNVSINSASLNALIDAYGEDSKDWQGHILTLETEKVRVAGKAVTTLYLIPDGYTKTDDENGYACIIKQSFEDSLKPENNKLPDETVTDEDISDVGF